MVGIAGNTVDLVENSKETRRTELTACNESLGEFDIRRGIFQGSSVLPLLFVVCSYTFIDTLQQKTNLGYVTSRNQRLIHLISSDDRCMQRSRENKIGLSRL